MIRKKISHIIVTGKKFPLDITKKTPNEVIWKLRKNKALCIMKTVLEICLNSRAQENFQTRMYLKREKKCAWSWTEKNGSKLVKKKKKFGKYH